MADSSTRILSAELGDFYYRSLILWASVEHQNKGAFIANIAKARISANKEQVAEGLKFYSKEYGLSVEELTDRIVELDTQGLSVTQIHKRLSKQVEGGEEEDDEESPEDCQLDRV